MGYFPTYLFLHSLGHSMGKDTASKHYIDEFSVKKLYDGVISEVKFEGLDLGHFKKSRFVVK